VGGAKSWLFVSDAEKILRKDGNFIDLSGLRDQPSAKRKANNSPQHKPNRALWAVGYWTVLETFNRAETIGMKKLAQRLLSEAQLMGEITVASSSTEWRFAVRAVQNPAACGLQRAGHFGNQSAELRFVEVLDQIKADDYVEAVVSFLAKEVDTVAFNHTRNPELMRRRELFGRIVYAANIVVSSRHCVMEQRSVPAAQF
jgi:hypothetical protein